MVIKTEGIPQRFSPNKYLSSNLEKTNEDSQSLLSLCYLCISLLTHIIITQPQIRHGVRWGPGYKRVVHRTSKTGSSSTNYRFQTSQKDTYIKKLSQRLEIK